MRFCSLVAPRTASAATFQTWRAFMLKNILVHIPSERSIRPIADSAISLAVMYGAHLDAVSIGFQPTHVGLPVDGGAAVAAMFEIDYESALARANAALAVFETEARNAGITCGVKPFTGGPAESVATVGALARLDDFTVALQPEPDRDTFDNTVPQEILFQSGGPVIFIPYTHKGPFEAKHIGIALDGSRSAALALHDAAPFLARAQNITIITINEKEIPADVSAATLKAHLGRHELIAGIV